MCGSCLCVGVAGIEEWSKVAGKEKKMDTLRLPPDGLQEAMVAAFQDKVRFTADIRSNRSSLYPSA